jgi:hypothetical protein
MKVVVELENGKRFTYVAEGVEVGTHVELPKPYFLTKDDAFPVGVVRSLESDYDGACKNILRVLDADEVTALE